VVSAVDAMRCDVLSCALFLLAMQLDSHCFLFLEKKRTKHKHKAMHRTPLAAPSQSLPLYSSTVGSWFL